MLGFIVIQTSLANSHHPEAFLQGIAGKPDEGRLIVQHYCAVCHASNPQIQLGAPRMQVKADWALRQKSDLETLLKHTREGINTMPPRGGCFECSDAQLLLAIKALLPP